MMKTIKNEIYSHQYQVKKSKFICYVAKVNNETEVKAFLQAYVDQKATHNCYAYLLPETEKFDDDGEPSNSAGAAMLAILKKHQLTNIITLTIRYFHPPQLGVGGLIRAYQAGVVNILKTISFLKIIASKIYQVSLPLACTNIVMRWTKIYRWKILEQKTHLEYGFWIINIPATFDITTTYHREIRFKYIAKSTIEEG